QRCGGKIGSEEIDGARKLIHYGTRNVVNYSCLKEVLCDSNEPKNRYQRKQRIAKIFACVCVESCHKDLRQSFFRVHLTGQKPHYQANDCHLGKEHTELNSQEFLYRRVAWWIHLLPPW